MLTGRLPTICHHNPPRKTNLLQSLDQKPTPPTQIPSLRPHLMLKLRYKHRRTRMGPQPRQRKTPPNKHRLLYRPKKRTPPLLCHLPQIHSRQIPSPLYDELQQNPRRRQRNMSCHGSRLLLCSKLFVYGPRGAVLSGRGRD